MSTTSPIPRRRWAIYWLTADDGALSTVSSFYGTSEGANDYARERVETGDVPRFASGKRAPVTGYAVVPYDERFSDYGSWRLSEADGEWAATAALEMTS